MEIRYVQGGFQKGQGTRDIILYVHWIVRKPKNIKKEINICFPDYKKGF